MLRSAEELFLLLLDEETASLAATPRRTLSLAFAGAVLMDLQIEGRIDSDLTEVTLVDDTPLDDDLLDPALLTIAASDRPRDAYFWVESIAKSAEQIQRRVIARLVRKGILVDPEGGSHYAVTPQVKHTGRYPTGDSEVRQTARFRVMRVLLDGDIPDPGDIVLINLAEACGVFQKILDRVELRQAKARIELLAGMDLIGQAVTGLLREVGPGAEGAAVLHSDLPVAKGLPIFGDVTEVLRFFTRQYMELGPIFQLKLFFKRYVVLAGPEANIFMQEREQFHFHTSGMWNNIRKELKASRFVLDMSGSEHFKMRREMRDGFSSNVLTKNIPKAVEIIRNHIDGWEEGQQQSGYLSMQRIIVDHLSALTVGLVPEGYTDDFIRWMKTAALNSLPVRGILPWRTPRYRRDRARVLALCGEVLKRHQLQHSQRDDMTDLGLSLHRKDPAFLPETDLVLWTLMPLIAGTDTAGSTTAFLLYSLLKRPSLMERVRVESDELFASGDGGIPTSEGLRNLDVIRRTMMETMRFYPIAPMYPRKVMSSFDFHGYHVPSGEDLMVAMPAAHYLPQLFPDPERFDIDRYLPGRDEHKQPGAFAAFGAGAHRCPGANLAMLQIPLIVATLLHEADLEMMPPDYDLKLVPAPFISPHSSFRFRLVKRRQPPRPAKGGAKT